MSKIARKLGRISAGKLDHETSRSPTPTTAGEGEGEGEKEDMVQSMTVVGGAGGGGGHTLQVPTPRAQHNKQMKSMSTSHLETSYEG